jgi:hypothetical protein
LINLQVSASSKFSVSKGGVISALGALLTSASATALAVGLNGSTNPAFLVDATEPRFEERLGDVGGAPGIARTQHSGGVVTGLGPQVDRHGRAG